MNRTHRTDPEEGTCSIADSSMDDNSRNSGIDTYSDRNSSSGSGMSELAIHTLLVETRARDLDREVYQDPDSDRYLIPGERVFDNAADDLETIAVLRAKRNDRMTSNLKRWIENGAPDKRDLEEDSYRILRQYLMQNEGRLYLNKDGIVACKRREEDKVLYKYNALVLPQLYQTELLFRSHDQMGHQEIDKVYERILKRFECPERKRYARSGYQHVCHANRPRIQGNCDFSSSRSSHLSLTSWCRLIIKRHA